jgi:hypothetical protein
MSGYAAERRLKVAPDILTPRFAPHTLWKCDDPVSQDGVQILLQLYQNLYPNRRRDLRGNPRRQEV